MAQTFKAIITLRAKKNTLFFICSPPVLILHSSGAAIPEEDAEKLTTVGKVLEYLKSKGYSDEAQA